jgi:hypothetical protein
MKTKICLVGLFLALAGGYASAKVPIIGGYLLQKSLQDPIIKSLFPKNDQGVAKPVVIFDEREARRSPVDSLTTNVVVKSVDFVQEDGTKYASISYIIDGKYVVSNILVSYNDNLWMVGNKNITYLK